MSPTPRAISRRAHGVTGTTLVVDGGQHLVPQPARRDVLDVGKPRTERARASLRHLAARSTQSPTGKEHACRTFASPARRLPAALSAQLRSAHQHRRARLREAGRAARGDQRRAVRAARAVDAGRGQAARSRRLRLHALDHRSARGARSHPLAGNALRRRRRRAARASAGACRGACRRKSRTCIPTAMPWASKSFASKRNEHEHARSS